MSEEITREPDDVAGGWIAAIVVALILFVWLCAGILWLLYPSVRNPEAAPSAIFAGPGLEVAPVADFAVYMTRQRALLAGADGRKPIDAAMAEVAARGTLAPKEAP